MKLSIFSRLLIGHLIIFILVIGMSAYAIVQIGRINEVTQSVLTVNNRMSDNAERLSDVVSRRYGTRENSSFPKTRYFTISSSNLKLILIDLSEK
jgi:CHASE3 domain sensor protein